MRRHEANDPRPLLGLVYEYAVDGVQGLLIVEGGQGCWQAEFNKGRMRSLLTPPRWDEPLGTWLLKAKLVNPSRLEDAVKISRAFNMLLGQALMKNGLEPGKLRTALKAQAHKRFMRFVTLAQGTTRFQPQISLGPRMNLGVPLDIIPALREQIQRPGQDIGCWLESIADLRIELVGKSPPMLFLSPEERSLMSMIRPGKTIRQILDKSTIGDKGAELIYFLHQVGVLDLRHQKDERDDLVCPSDPIVLKKWWRRMALMTHPDLHPEADQAALKASFISLRRKYEQARA